MSSSLPYIRTSERKCFRRCPQQWKWSYVDGLSSSDDTPGALWLGTGVHIALADWYRPGKKRGPHPAQTFREWAGDEVQSVHTYQGGDFEYGQWEDATDLGIAMLENYIDYYGKDPDWNVIATEQAFRVKITREGRAVATFFGTFDGVYRDESDGGIYLMEHKTAAQISTAYLALDDQAGGYWAVASKVLQKHGVLNQGENIAGITYNFLRKARPDERPQNDGGAFLNKNGTVSKRQPPPHFVREVIPRSPEELRSTLVRLSDEVYLMQEMREGRLPIIKNTTRECTFCEFFSMCHLHERGGNAWKTIAEDYTTRDPYADYMKSTGE